MLDKLRRGASFAGRSALLVISSQLWLWPCQGQQKTRQWIGDVSVQLSQVETTQKQQTYGGSVSVINQYRKTEEDNYCDSKSWFTKLDLSGNHNATSQAGSSPITLDSDDDSASADRWIKPRTAVGARAEVYLNNSLGIGQEQIYALDIQQLVYCKEPSKKLTWQTFKLLGDVRYVHERLYETPGELDLAGLSLGERWVFRRRIIDKTGKRKTAFTMNETIQVTPMVNDITALQAYGDVKLTFPLAVDSLKLDIEEEEHYLGNAPHGFDKHYQQTSISLKYSFGGAEQ